MMRHNREIKAGLPPLSRRSQTPRRWATLLLVLVLLLGLSACGDYQRLDKLIIVAGMAVDGEPGNLHVTLETASASGGDTGDQVTPHLLEGKGANLDEALANIGDSASGKLYMNLCAVAVVADKAAGIIPALVGELVTNPDFNINAGVLVAQGATAKSILESEPSNNSVMSYDLAAALEQNVKDSCTTVPADTSSIYDTLADPDAVAVFPAVSLAGEQSHPQVAGAALFSGGRLKGFLTAEETTVYLFAKNLVQGGEITVSDTPEETDGASARIVESDTSWTPEVADHQLRITLNVKVKLALQSGGDALPAGADAQSKTISLYQQALSQRISEGITALEEKYRLDLFGFGAEVQKKYPEQWQALVKNGNALVQIPATIHCHVTLQS